MDLQRGSTVAIGLTGANYSYAYTGTGGGTAQSSRPSSLTNKSGQVIGESDRLNANGFALGNDAWLFDGTTTVPIGLTGPAYGYTISAASGGIYQSNYANGINDSGQAIGRSERYGPPGFDIGTDAWIFDGTSTHFIGLTGGIYSHTSANGFIQQYGVATQLNNAGQAAGYAYRYDSSGNSLGQGAWFFDSNTDTTTELVFSIDTANNYAYTNPDLLTGTGVVLGNYELFDGSNDLGGRAFYWSESAGFHDLGALVPGGLSAFAWQFLADVYASATPGAVGLFGDESPQYILGDGFIAGQSGPLNMQDLAVNNRSVFLLTAVPEPTSSLISASGSLAVLIRRPRNKNCKHGSSIAPRSACFNRRKPRGC
jgi:hypothetical protein